MSLLKPFSKLPGLNTANILLVENEEQFQQKLADTVVLQEKTVNVNVRLARSLPLPMENEESRPRIDLVVFIIHLTSELSFQSAETSLKYLDPGYFQGKVCFLVTSDNRGGDHSSTPITGHSQGSGRSCPYGNWSLPVHLDPLHCAL
ncbi:centromere protein M isoform X3 [Oncorhynchus mykiss]|uniref:centromere protein M isoform X3 n=1 Tax=Oncorhynchus mykiss TaxID=8022 RepID=UPI001877A136|nr:centromere protein M isoform X3 [Oncorhynchus mykiss]